MKNRFFLFWNRVNLFVYKFITKLAYIKIINKKCCQKNVLSISEKKNIKKYWKNNFNKNISLKEYNWYKSLKVTVSPKLIPDLIWHSEIEPFFCNINYEKAVQDKNYLDTIVERKNSPETLLRCINNELLNGSYEHIDVNQCMQIIRKYDEVILKPSIDSGGGRNIQFLKPKVMNEIKINKLIEEYDGNFIIQKIIEQSQFLSKFNSKSINTIRVMSLLYKGNVFILSSFLRIGGKNSRTDNVSTGGAFIPISLEGKLKEYAFVENLKSHSLEQIEKLDNNIEFANCEIPEWNNIKYTITKYHYRLPHFGIINWDVSINKKGDPIIIEYNLIDSSCSFHQIGNGPIFGEMTEMILNDIYNSKGR